MTRADRSLRRGEPKPSPGAGSSDERSGLAANPGAEYRLGMGVRLPAGCYHLAKSPVQREIPEDARRKIVRHVFHGLAVGRNGWVRGRADLRVIGAVRQHDLMAVRALVKQGVDVNAAEGDAPDVAPLGGACGRPGSGRPADRAGARVNAATDLGITPLWVASTNGSPATIAKLLDAAAGIGDLALHATRKRSRETRASRSGRRSAISHV
jgi:hypothetical protein